MEQRVVQRRIEHPLLLVGAALDADARKVVVPACAGLFPDSVESRTRRLLRVEIPTSVLRTYIGNAHAHLDLFARPQVVEREPVAHVVARHLAAVLRIEFVAAVVGRPLRLDARHRTLLLPVARSRRDFRHPQNEIDRKHLLRVIAERPQQFRALDLRGAHAAHHRARLVREALAKIQQQVSLAAGERIPFGRGARRGRGLGEDVVLVEVHRIIARRGPFVAVGCAVLAIVHRQRSGRRHRQQRPHIRAPHAAQRPVREAREELVVVLVGRGPPPRVLVVEVLRRTHHVERNHRHHPVRGDGSRVRSPEIRRPDKRVDLVSWGLRRSRSAENGCGERCQKKRSSQSHHRIEFFFVNSMISGR